MTFENHLILPSYESFVESIEVLNLPYSASELHGIMCGYLCASAYAQGETFLRALMGSHKDDAIRSAALALFSLYSVSQQQISTMDFDFQLLLPDENETIHDRAQAFSEWCDGFTHGLGLSGVSMDHFHEEEAQDAIQHLSEFAEMDYDALEVSDEDEKALMEVSEYTRMAVLRLHGDLISDGQNGNGSHIAH